MSLSASRTVFRRSHLLLHRGGARNASSATETAQAAKEKTQQTTSRASEGLSRVTSSASSAITTYGSAAGNALGRIGGRTGRLIGAVNSLIPPTIYYSKVALELGKIVVKQRGMAPPSTAQFQSYWQPILNAIRHPASISSRTSSTIGDAQSLLSRARNLNRQEALSVSIILAEVIGFFTVGEMIGRLKIVGYRGSTAHGHH
ncbi:putative mitochondrial F1F0-ATP synthase g subunit [Patellaria atrata CBS 101060]|uniref:Mitochondrial F1F0-ATP synthase g subunit n=1 Tax=Patellaria atrata CBS 101060 TaxID=1346257 RepID=A0A9P4SAV1_9PEZI|nr:putative mitochondrial F1F0-ATP synthase g subunit [Patellaria atrata CBS 101060]